jgi:opacity protein-like surface antigen
MTFRKIAKKIVFIHLSILLLLACVTTVSAQVREVLEAIKPKKEFTGTPVLQQKSQLLQFGVAAPNNVATLLNFGGIGSFLNSSEKGKVGPFFLAYEYMIKENLGIGATVSYARAKKTYSNPFGSGAVTGDLAGTSLLLSTTYHFYITDKLDPYAKASIGATLWKGSYKNNDGTEAEKITLPAPVGYSALIGLRYFVSPKFAPFGELSYSNLKFSAGLGIAIKLK